jgi:hypothetical protein
VHMRTHTHRQTHTHTHTHTHTAWETPDQAFDPTYTEKR